MPCCTAWNEFLTPGSVEYKRAEELVEAKLKAVMHVVDYYYKAFDFSLPDLEDGTEIDPFRQPRSSKEIWIREMICHHLACDEVHFCTLYDVCSLLDRNVKIQRAYLAVILPCATLLRQDTEKFK